MATIATVTKTTLKGAILLVNGVERCRVEATMVEHEQGLQLVNEAVAKWQSWYPHARSVQIIG